jgi:hypothetical protein
MFLFCFSSSGALQITAADGCVAVCAARMRAAVDTVVVQILRQDGSRHGQEGQMYVRFGVANLKCLRSHPMNFFVVAGAKQAQFMFETNPSTLPREKDLIHVMKDEEMTRNLPGKLKLMGMRTVKA